MKGLNWYIFAAAGIHALFMVFELYPWGHPLVLNSTVQDWAQKRFLIPFAGVQQELMAAVVHNAGIYNAMVASALFYACVAGPTSYGMARVLLIGAVVAGFFGTITLKSYVLLVQAVVSGGVLVAAHLLHFSSGGR